MNSIESIINFIVPSGKNNYRPRLLYGKALIFFVVFVLVLKIGLISISIRLPQNLFFADITRVSLESFVNQTRESLGLKPLLDNAKLDRAAWLKAENMIQNQYFSHTSPTGISPWYWFKQAGYAYKYAGENLALGFFESEEVFIAWLNSADHRANIVNPNYTEFGTAVLGGFGQNNAIVVVQEFGSRGNLEKTPANNSAASVQATPLASAKPIESTEPTPVELVEPSPIENSNSLFANQESPKPNGQVLSQATAPQIYETTAGRNTLSLRLMNLIVYNYDSLLQNILYGISLLITGILIMLILFYPRRELILRAVIIIAILATATFLDKGVILSLIPHEIII